MRDRLAAIATERQALEKVFAAGFPDYAGPSHPQPLTVTDIQGLLSGDEALVLFAPGDKGDLRLCGDAHGPSGLRASVHIIHYSVS